MVAKKKAVKKAAGKLVEQVAAQRTQSTKPPKTDSRHVQFYYAAFEPVGAGPGQVMFPINGTGPINGGGGPPHRLQIVTGTIDEGRYRVEITITPTASL